MPKGNNYYGKDISESGFPNKAVTAAWYSGKTAKTATGSDPESWYHNGTYARIADLNRNITEWVSGLSLNNGEIQIITNNDTADWSNSCAANSTKWKTISQNGSLSAPSSENTFKLDYKSSITSPGSTSNCYLNILKKMNTPTAVSSLKV